MAPINASFDANQFEPKQSTGGHPVGNKFPFEITHTEVKANKAEDGGMFIVTFTSPVGQIDFRYNLFNKSAKAVEIANGQLSALCRAVGRYQLNFNDDGKALLGARGCMDVGFQKGHEPTAENPEGGYVEIKRVYDTAGNEPGKTSVQPAQQMTQPQPRNQPMVSQPGGGWGTRPSQPQATQQPSQGWQNGAQNAAPQQQSNPAAQQNVQGQSWQPGGQTAANPPWGSRT